MIQATQRRRRMQRVISFELNGKPVRLSADPGRSLLWVLREDLGLTGTKFGCGAGLCGTCTVVVEKQAVRSCATPLSAVEGKRVLTIEGLGRNGRLHPLQQALLDHHAFQCAFCTPGMIMNAYALLLRHPQPTREQIIQAMDENLCRCGSHPRIVAAIEQAAKAVKLGGAR